HKVECAAQERRSRPDGAAEAKGLEAPHAQGVRVGDDFLVIAVGAFAGTARRIEALPRWGAALDGSNEAGVVFERHAMTIAQDAVAVRAVLLLLGGARSAADILPTVGLIVVAIGATQTTTGGIGRAVLIIAPVPERL